MSERGQGMAPSTSRQFLSSVVSIWDSWLAETEEAALREATRTSQLRCLAMESRRGMVLKCSCSGSYWTKVVKLRSSLWSSMTRPTWEGSSVVTSALTATVEVATSEDGLVSAARVDSVDAAVSSVLVSATFSVERSVVVDSDDSATVEVVVVVGAMVDSVSDSFTTFGSLKLSGCSVEDSVVDVDSVAASVDVAALGSSEEEDRDSDTSVVCVFSSISSDVEVDVVVVDVDVDMVEDSEEAESTLSLDSSAVEVESVELVRVSELERSEVSVVDDSTTVD